MHIGVLNNIQDLISISRHKATRPSASSQFILDSTRFDAVEIISQPLCTSVIQLFEV